MINLEKYSELKEELRCITLTIEELKTQLYKIKNNEITDLPRCSNTKSNDERITNLICKIEKKINTYYTKYDECYSELDKILNIVENLVGIEKTIITEKYINNLTWDEISNITHYSRMQLYRLHKKILEKINMIQNVT